MKKTLLDLKITCKFLPNGSLKVDFNETHISPRVFPGNDGKEIHDIMVRIIQNAKNELSSFSGNVPIQS